MSDLSDLFTALYVAATEEDVDKVISQNRDTLGGRNNWYPLDKNESNFGVIENQQSSPIAAIVEKLTNSIDAILMRKCYEAGVEPTSPGAPRTMEEAIKRFFRFEYESWHLSSFRRKQAEEIQIHADGPRMNTSLIVYDNGEGQHPEDFEKTFLSLLRGNKNEIPFVQGKYNMGGTGAIVFCGKKRYQLIGSRYFDGTGVFGFTVIRRHPLTQSELRTKKNTWYEYLKLDGMIPSFAVDELDLGIKGRKFKTGTVIKLYSYDLPSGSRSVISRDLNQSLNEYLFEPALPIYTIDKPERYPKDRELDREFFGLKRRLEEDDSKYVEAYFSETYESSRMIGQMRITCYIFKNRIDGRSAKETRDSIDREFFKNNMAVLFSLNGQVHGHYTSEFITRSLKMPLLKNHLLIHVDCTHMRLDFRNELFMASRDRLKGADETRQLRELLTDILTKSKLQEIYKRRKDSISFDGSDTNELLRNFAKSLPLNSDLLKLLNNTFKLDLPKRQIGPTPQKKPQAKEKEESFDPKRFPTIFKIRGECSKGKPVASIPLGGQRTVKFETDVEDQYFDRTHEPGDLKLSLLSFESNDVTGGNDQGSPKSLSDLLNITKSSPSQGTIKIAFSPTRELQVGDMVQINALLEGPGTELEQRFWVKIVAPEKLKVKSNLEDEDKQESLGLPQLIRVYQEPRENCLLWEEFETRTGMVMDFETIIHPMVEGDRLESVYINMDSGVLKDYKSRLKSPTEEQLEFAEKKYLSSVYFHALFLFTISKKRNYNFQQEEQEKDVSDFLKDVFSSHYAEFLLNFGNEQLINAIGI
jgi:hypothetical protein